MGGGRRCIVDNVALLINYSVSRRTQWLKPKMFALLPSQMIILLMEKTCWKCTVKSLLSPFTYHPPFFIIPCPSVYLSRMQMFVHISLIINAIYQTLLWVKQCTCQVQQLTSNTICQTLTLTIRTRRLWLNKMHTYNSLFSTNSPSEYVFLKSNAHLI